MPFRTHRRYTVPTIDTVPLGNSGAYFEATFLVVDIRKSSVIIESNWHEASAKALKMFLTSMTVVARFNSGEVRSFDGDSIMAVFPDPPSFLARGDSCVKGSENALIAAMQMKRCLVEIIRPMLSPKLDCGIGIDCGRVLVVRAGIKGTNNNDLVWIGTPPNRATKLADIACNPNNIAASSEVYARIPDQLRWGADGNIWSDLHFQYAGKPDVGVSTAQFADWDGTLIT